MKGKRGYIISYADWLKGFIIGLVVGAIITYLLTAGIVKMPAIFSSQQIAKVFIPLIV